MKSLERIIIGLESVPWNVLYRAAFGLLIMPIYFRWAGNGEAFWKMVVVFVGLLVALRIAPGVLRRGLPFSGETKTIWAQRRELAKRYDSYQWQKLLGIGIGWVGGIFLSNRTAVNGALLLAIACAVAGAVGMVIWEKQRRSSVQPVAAT